MNTMKYIHLGEAYFKDAQTHFDCRARYHIKVIWFLNPQRRLAQTLEARALALLSIEHKYASLLYYLRGVLLGRHLNVNLVDNPLAQETLTTLRDRNTDRVNFRRGLALLGMLTGVEITRTMDYAEVEVETPLGAKSRGISLTDARNLVVINVLRAALPFVEGLVEILPEARLGVVSARRVELGVAAPDYRFKIEMPYFRVPAIHPEDTLIIADPMLASGSTLLALLDGLMRVGSPKRVIAASVVAAPLGVERVNARYSTVEVFTVALDEGLNEHGYIIPGLGDAGNRVCG